MRVLKWIIERCENRDGATESPVGQLPRNEDIDLAEMESFSRENLDELLAVKTDEWKKEVAEHGKFFESLGGVVPDRLLKLREKLAERLGRSD
jgi:phosphoenolpyruvate carboxykinase (GTP)